MEGLTETVMMNLRVTQSSSGGVAINRGGVAGGGTGAAGVASAGSVIPGSVAAALPGGHCSF